MPVIVLDDPTDERLEPFIDLRHDTARPRGKYFVAEGRLLVERLIASQYNIVSLLVTHGHENEFASLLPVEIPVYSLPPEQLKSLVGFDFHRGVMALAERQPLRSMDAFEFDPHDLPIAIGLVGIYDPANVGGIMRSAAAFGIRHVLIGPGTIDPFARRVLRVSMGNLFKQRLYHWDTPEQQIETLSQQKGIDSLATTLAEDSIPLDEYALRCSNQRPSGLLIIAGHESEGIPEAIQQTATHRVSIPMSLGTDSLNVSAASSIFMYALSRVYSS